MYLESRLASPPDVSNIQIGLSQEMSVFLFSRATVGQLFLILYQILVDPVTPHSMFFSMSVCIFSIQQYLQFILIELFCIFVYIFAYFFRMGEEYFFLFVTLNKRVS